MTEDGAARSTNAGAVVRPSMFWARLGSEHQRELDAYGPEGIKRRQALRYFTWRWGLSALPRSEQFRFLVSHTSPRQWLEAACGRQNLSDQAWHGVAWSRRDRWLYSFATRLLWDFARTRDVLGVLDRPEPELGGPLPVRRHDRLISQDLANSSLEASAIARALDGRTPRSIIEVGAGYGRTAYALLHVFPDATYTIIDIEPALSISRWYLSQLFPTERLRFLRPDDVAPDWPARFDLGVSISSLAEMTVEQVRHYLDLFGGLVAGGTVYLKQWESWRNPDDGVTLTFDRYPIPATWELLFKERAPVQTRFMQAAWRVPTSRKAQP